MTLTVAVALLPLAIALLSALPAAAAEPDRAAAAPDPEARQISVGEVTVAARDAAGEPVPGLSPDDLVVRQGGEASEVLEVRPERRPWRVAVYLDTALAASRTVPRATRALEILARDLTELGTVEVVAAGERVRTVQPADRDPVALAAGLGRVGLMEDGADAVVALRRDALRELDAASGPAERRRVVEAAVQREAELVRQRFDLLLGWAVDRGREKVGSDGDAAAEGPAVLLWVGDGFDVDPAAFWRQRTGVEVQPPAGLAAAHGELARTLAGLGWTVVPVTLRDDRDPPESRFGSTTREDPETGEERVLGTVRLPRRKTAAEKAEEELERQAGPPPLPRAPEAALDELATASGGRVLVATGQLPDLVEELASRFRVRYASLSDPRPAAPNLLPLRVAGTGGLDLTARLWTARGVPAAVSALRARSLLAGELDPGEVTVRAAVALDEPPTAGRPVPARIEVRLEPPPGTEPEAGPRRVTLAALPAGGGEPRVQQRTVEGEVRRGAGVELSGVEPAPIWIYEGEVELPPDTERVAVVVERPDDAGGWGGTVAGLFDVFRDPGADYDAAAGLLPGPKPVNLLRPEGLMLSGTQRFETVVEPGVERVDFYVDGERGDRAEAAPFTGRLDLGRLPLPRRVEAVAFGAGGEELGRDTLLVNGGGGRFRVRFVTPRGPRAVGDVAVAVDVELPRGDTLDRLELYWKDRLVATLFQPPFRHRLRIEPDAAEGFLRAVGRLPDGTVAEDVVYLNGPLAAERVDVRLTELYVVVTGPDGRPVRDLGAEDFAVREDGERQEIETFSAAGDLPITVGLAVDSSASMFVKLSEVQEAAAEFLGELEQGRDRAFLVDFDGDVRLVAPPTRDLVRVRRAGDRLVAGGRTSLWKGIVFSLVQLQGAPGRKALVVYSDGADEDDDFSYRTALDFARKVGVPIYVIVSNDEAVRTGALSLGFPSLGKRLQRLTSLVGGRVWVVRRGDDLSGVYRQIQRELSAQYLLGYYPGSDERGDWRRVEVDVLRRGHHARTLSGYER